MQLIAASVSGFRYCGSSVVASPLWLSSTEPYAKNAGHPLGQPLAFASGVGWVFVCSTVTKAFVAVDPVKEGKSAALLMLSCVWPSGASVMVALLPICVLFAPLKSLTTSVVVENCDAFTKPRLLR